MSAYYRKRYKHGRGKLRRYIIVGVIILFIVLFFIYYQSKVDKIIISVSKTYVESITAKAVNEAVFSSAEDVYAYKELIVIQRNESGDIIAITSDPLKINSLARKTATLAQLKLEEMTSDGVKIPIGAFSGMEIFAGAGPMVSVNSLKINNVTCDFTSEFDSVGINQTLHSIYIQIHTEVNIVFSAKTVPVIQNSKVLVAESVIVGKVPDTYFGSNILSGI